MSRPPLCRERAPGAIVSYDFGEGLGSTVADTSDAGEPLDLTIADAENVTWVPGGLRVDVPTTIASAAGAAKVVDAVQASGAVTLEAWIVPEAGAQTGSARIVSNGGAAGSNFMVGQGADDSLAGDVFTLRTRTSTSPTARQSCSPRPGRRCPRR